MNAVSEGNAVQLVLDGENFFRALEDLLDTVAKAEPGPDTYVRLAYWEISQDLRLPSGTTLVPKLKGVADQGHPVDLIMWCPARLDVRFDKNMSAGILAVNEKTAAQVGRYDSKNKKRPDGRIRCLLEVYNGWNGSSVHQKIALFSVAGKLTALIGGLNLANFYWDNEAHDGDEGGGMGEPPLENTVHDTALLLRGPGAVDIETEWLRRWQKRFYEVGTLTGQAGRATSPISDPTEYDELPRARRDEQLHKSQKVSVQIATTNSESYLGRSTDIQSLLVEEIRKAQDSIYFEGFAFSDPTLVTELVARLKKPRPPKVCVMVPYPYKGNPFPFDYLNYISFAKLSLAGCTHVTVAGKRVARDDCSVWKINESLNAWSTLRSITSMVSNTWLEKDSFTFHPQGGTSTTVPLLSLEGFEGDRVRFLAPFHGDTAIYIHSKLALFDDRVAVVGSANFTYRSMVYDGELSAFIRDEASARSIRDALYGHYVDGYNPTKCAWIADSRYVRARKEDVPSRAHGLVALTVNDFPRVLPDDPSYKKINHTFI
ncbi:phosphatidylserine/phosphatidylglycerophosphate/cardiolipin synthase family protein [Corallococcus sp. Z5C101001]|uniref:phospholipase D-like domain-containing protein n=1 Tax=Corallococcus sp. Z5C101001 TaxID=2596829 RepID=UPI00163DA839|nr:phospholipase D-like domain-containing protein [Corallococcus sp. Z5C101001]